MAVRVNEILGANPFSIEPSTCAGWIADLDSLQNLGTESGNEVLHQLTAIRPGNGDTETVILYINSKHQI